MRRPNRNPLRGVRAPYPSIYTPRMTSLAHTILDAAIETFAYTESTGRRALAQVRSDRDVHRTPLYDGNSIAVIVKHLHGNMLSRWTDFLTTDGEKPTRRRDDEFIDDMATLGVVRRRWDEGWACVLGTMRSLTEDDLEKTITIRGQAHSVARAIMRQTEHYAYHTGQLVSLCKHVVGNGWETLTVPRGGTAAHNASMEYDPGGADGAG